MVLVKIEMVSKWSTIWLTKWSAIWLAAWQFYKGEVDCKTLFTFPDPLWCVLSPDFWIDFWPGGKIFFQSQAISNINFSRKLQAKKKVVSRLSTSSNKDFFAGAFIVCPSLVFHVYLLTKIAVEEDCWLYFCFEVMRLTVRFLALAMI